MIKEGLKRSVIGIAFGGAVTFIAVTVLMVTDTPVTASEIWFHMLLAYILGIYFGLSSLIFTENNMSSLKQTVIHYLMSIFFYFLIAYIGNWLLFTPAYILIAILIFTAIYAINWMAYYLYYKRVAERLNANINRGKK